MNKREDCIKRITKSLSRLQSEIMLRNTINLFDASIFSENFCRDLFNQLYPDRKYKNINEITPNSVAIDIGDREARHCVQITSDNSSAKIRDAIEKFEKNGLHHEYSKLNVLLLVEKKNYTTDFSRSAGAWTFKNSDVIDFSDIIKIINSKETGDIESIANFLVEEIGLSGDNLRQKEKDDLLCRYKEWILQKTSSLRIPFVQPLPFSHHYQSRKVVNLHGDKQPFNSESILDLYRRCILVSDSGLGKSTTIKKLVRNLINHEKKALFVRLPEVLRLYKQGKSFWESILVASTDGLDFELSLFQSLFNNPDCLLIDGLDECETTYQATIVDKILDWANGHQSTKIVIASRPTIILERLPNWQFLELQPLSKEDSKRFIDRTLDYILDSDLDTQEKSALTKKISREERLVSIVSATPIFAGFIISLAKRNINITTKNKAEIYKEVIELASKHFPDSRDVMELDKRSAQKVLDIIGWNLIQTDYYTEEELIETIIKELQEAGYSLEIAESKANKGVCFWKDRQLLRSSIFAQDSRIEYSHFSLCEYSAAQYVSCLNKNDFRKWLLEAKEDLIWHSVILFSSGLGMGEKIISVLTETHDENSWVHNRQLIIKVAREDKNISKSSLKGLVDRILQLLSSESPSKIFEGTEALLNLLPAASEYISMLAKNLLESSNHFTRMAALRLVIACESEDIDIGKANQIIQEILADPCQGYYPDITPFGLRMPPNNEGKRICEPAEWHIRNEILLHGSQLLLQRQGGIKIAKQTWDILLEKTLTRSSQDVLHESLIRHIHEILKCDKSNEELNDYKLLNSQIGKEISRQLFELDRSSILGGFLQAESNLKKLQKIQKDRRADLIFLESILRVTQNHQENTNKYNLPSSREPVSLGILFKGMGWWGMPCNQWTQLNQSLNHEAIDTVISGMTAALSINKNSLRSEALDIIKNVHSFFKLDLAQIEDLLKSNSSQDTVDALYYLTDTVYANKDFYLGLVHQIPGVPIKFNWGCINQIQFSTQALINAIQHPSLGISQNAALLIKYGAGGEETKTRVKELAGVDAWSKFEATLPDILSSRLEIVEPISTIRRNNSEAPTKCK